MKVIQGSLPLYDFCAIMIKKKGWCKNGKNSKLYN